MVLSKWIVAGAIAAFTTAAQGAGGHEGACKEDVQKLCKDVQPGEGRLVECLKSHKAEVSPKCATHMKEVQQAVKQVSAACEPDIEKFCFDTPIGKGAIASCLKKHSADLSSDCKAAVAKAKSAKAAKPQ